MAIEPGKARRLEPYAGLAYVVCFVGSVIASSPPKDSASSRQWIASYSGRGKQAGHLATGVLLLLAGLALMTFLVGLWRQIAVADPTNRPSPLPIAAAAAAAGLMGAGGMVMGYISGGEILGSYPLPSVDLLRLSNDLGFALAGIAGMWAAGIAVIALSVQGHRAGFFSPRMRTAGIATGCVLALSPLFVPIIALLAWVVAASIEAIRHPATAPRPERAHVAL